MTISARSSFVVACVAAVLLVACGGEEQETRTIVETKTETVTREQPPAPGPDQPPPTGQAPALEPLPPGVVGADGTYAMTVRDSNSEGSDIAEDDTFPGVRVDLLHELRQAGLRDRGATKAAVRGLQVAHADARRGA